MNSYPGLGLVISSPGRGLGFTDTSVHPMAFTLIVSPTFAGVVPFENGIEFDVEESELPIFLEEILDDELLPGLVLLFMIMLVRIPIIIINMRMVADNVINTPFIKDSFFVC